MVFLSCLSAKADCERTPSHGEKEPLPRPRGPPQTSNINRTNEPVHVTKDPSTTTSEPSNVSEETPLDPRDTLGPPTRVWRYIVNKLKKVVETSEKKLETNMPKVHRAYETVKCK